MNCRILLAAAAGLAVSSAAAPAAAQDDRILSQTPEAVQKLYDCRNIADPTQRLSCYDTQVADIASKQQSEDILITDRETVREARRGLFGLSLPSIRLFSGGDEEEFNEINTTIARAWRVGTGQWAFELEDGARWVQNDTFSLYSDIDPGTEVTIAKGALSSYTAKIGNRRAIKVKRVQ